MSDKEELSALCLSYLKPPKFTGGSWTLNPDALADAIIEAGWSKNLKIENPKWTDKDHWLTATIDNYLTTLGNDQYLEWVDDTKDYYGKDASPIYDIFLKKMGYAQA